MNFYNTQFVNSHCTMLLKGILLSSQDSRTCFKQREYCIGTQKFSFNHLSCPETNKNYFSADHISEDVVWHVPWVLADGVDGGMTKHNWGSGHLKGRSHGGLGRVGQVHQ